MIPLPTNYKRLIILMSILTSLSVTLAFNLLAYGLPSSASSLPLMPPPEAIAPPPPPPASVYPGTSGQAAQIFSIVPLASYDATPDQNYDFYIVTGNGFNVNADIEGIIKDNVGAIVPAAVAIIYVNSNTELIIGVPAGIIPPPNPSQLFLGSSFAFQVLSYGGITSQLLAVPQPAQKMPPPKPVKPAITSLSPSSKDSKSEDFELTITGTDFTPDAKVYIKKTNRTDFYYLNVTERTGKTEIKAKVPGGTPKNVSAAWVPGTYNISIINATGIFSPVKVLTISTPEPTITKAVLKLGQPNNLFGVLTITGTGFVPGATVKLNGQVVGQQIYHVNSSTEIIIESLGLMNVFQVNAQVPIVVTNPSKTPATYNFMWKLN